MVGVPRRKNLPASEKAVDIYNIISMESKLCLDAHDIDKIPGNVTLKLTDGTETFYPLSRTEPKKVDSKVFIH